MPEYSTPKELARDLYDRTVEPGDTCAERVRIACLANRVALSEWKKRVSAE